MTSSTAVQLPPAARQLARQIVDSLHELLAVAADSDGAPAEPESVGIDRHSRVVRRGAEEIVLTKLEFELLAYLDQHPRRAVTRDELLQAVWRQSPEFGSRTVDVHVRRLRAKLGPEFQLTTVRGFGYRFDGWSAVG